MHIVRYLTFAHHIIELDEGGNIVQQGTLGEFRASKRFTKLLESADKRNHASSSNSSGNISTTDQLAAKTPVQSASALDMTRKTGDFSLYRFYLRTVGRWLFIGWLICSGAYIFSSRIPGRTLSPLQNISGQNAKLGGKQTYGSAFGPKKAPLPTQGHTLVATLPLACSVPSLLVLACSKFLLLGEQ